MIDDAVNVEILTVPVTRILRTAAYRRGSRARHDVAQVCHRGVKVAISLERTPAPNIPLQRKCNPAAGASERAFCRARLKDLYDRYFEIIPAQTAEQLTASFRLRYEVYCVENPFEDPAENPDGLESDFNDARALHSLLVHRATGDLVGTVRLVLPYLDKSGMGLPIRNICDHELLAEDNPTLPWASTAEISRFAVSKKLRQRVTDLPVAGGDLPPETDTRRRIPDTSLGLMQAVIAMASASGITHLCAVMDPTLLRMLRRLGMDFPSLGPLVKHHGLRQPCYANLDTGLAKTWLARREVWELLTRDGDLWPLNTDVVARIRAGSLDSEASLALIPA